MYEIVLFESDTVVAVLSCSVSEAEQAAWTWASLFNEVTYVREVEA